MASVKQAWIKKYGDQAEEKYKEYLGRLSFSRTLQGYIARHGEVDGTRLYLEKNSKLSVGESSLRKRGYTDAQIVNIRINHKAKSMQTLENFIIRYGEVLGEVKYNEYRHKNKLTSNRRIDYWLKKTDGDLEKAKVMLHEWQQRDIRWYTNKYGDIDGLERYYQANKKKGRTLENYINRYGPDQGLVKFKKACENWKINQRGIFNSTGQLELEEFLRSIYPDTVGIREEVGMILTDNERELIGNSVIYPDMIINKRLVLEYDGDYWHANPKLFPEEDLFIKKVNKTVKQIRERDAIRDLIYRGRGYEVIRIWDSEWQLNKEFTKNKIIKIIENENN